MDTNETLTTEDKEIIETKLKTPYIDKELRIKEQIKNENILRALAELKIFLEDSTVINSYTLENIKRKLLSIYVVGMGGLDEIKIECKKRNEKKHIQNYNNIIHAVKKII